MDGGHGPVRSEAGPRRARRTRGFQGGRERAVVARRAKCPPEFEDALAVAVEAEPGRVIPSGVVRRIAFGVLIALAAAPARAVDVIPLKLPSGRVLQTEVMIKDEDRAMGLMFRPSLPRD